MKKNPLFEAMLPILENIEFKKLLWTIKVPKPFTSDDFSDTFNKNLFIESYKDVLRYCRKNKLWYKWNKKKWKHIKSSKRLFKIK